MNPPTSSLGLWRRIAHVVQHEGAAGLASRAWRRLAGTMAAGWEALRWAQWRLIGRATATVNGCTMHLDPRDPGISRELALYHTHEPLATALAVPFASSARTILDLGSNIGYYALLFLTRIEPRPRLIAIEPASRNLERLRRNLADNGLTEAATVIHAAVSDRCGEGTLNLARESNWHTLLPADSRHSDAETVPVVTLDALTRQLGLESLDLIRMDIEGYETVVFQGMHQTLQCYRPRLIIELHPQLTGPGPILELLHTLRVTHGYRAEHVVDRELDYAHLRGRAIPLQLDELLRTDLSHRCFTVFMVPT